jgi:hypothetical protein
MQETPEVVAAPEAEDVREGVGRKRALAAAALFLALAIALTWPLSLHLTDRTPSQWRDSRIITYLLAWDAHALKTDPTDLFQANYYFPEPDALAYTDHLLGLGIFAAPIDWATGNPFLAHNIVFILGMAFAGWAAFLLAYELTHHVGASLAGGVAFAFAPYWFGHTINLSHIQAISSGWIPMSLLGIVRWSKSGSARHLALGAGAFVMATLTSWYQGTFLAIALAITALVLLTKRPPKPLGKLLLQCVVAGLIVGAILIPFTRPYARVSKRYPQTTSSAAQAREFSARPSSYLSAARDIQVWGPVTSSFRRRQTTVETNLFPGALIALLAGIGFVGAAWRRETRRYALALAAVAGSGVLLALGTGTGLRRYLPWTILADHIAAFEALRVPARAHVLTVLGLAMLAAFGARALLRRFPKRSTLIAAGLIAILVAEGTSVPLKLGTTVEPAPIYQTLASRPGGILELPTIYFRNGKVPNETVDINWMLASTVHWRPIANGIASFKPPSYYKLIGLLARFPDARSLAEIRRRGIRTLVVHTDMLAGTPWVAVETRLVFTPGVRVIGRERRIVVYDVAP